MKTILFQGDSITDAGRNRDYDPHRGSGYATIVFNDIKQEKNAWLNFENIGQYKFSKYIELIDALKSINHNVDVYMTTADLEEYTLNFNLIYSTKP